MYFKTHSNTHFERLLLCSVLTLAGPHLAWFTAKTSRAALHLAYVSCQHRRAFCNRQQGLMTCTSHTLMAHHTPHLHGGTQHKMQLQHSPQQQQGQARYCCCESHTHTHKDTERKPHKLPFWCGAAKRPTPGSRPCQVCCWWECA